MYSVFNPRGEKIADCGIERDAVNLMNSRNQRWEGHYFTYTPPPAEIIDINNNYLPTNTSSDWSKGEYIEIESGKLQIQQSLSQEVDFE